jgi:hypothetical protein
MAKKKPEPRVKRDLGGLTPKRFQELMNKHLAGDNLLPPEVRELLNEVQRTRK